MNFEKYKNSVPYPNKNRLKESMVSIPISNFVGTRAEIDAEKKRLTALYEEGWEILFKEYRKEEDSRIKEFWEDCFKEVGIPINHPKAQLLMSIAWQRGHYLGLPKVYLYFLELIEKDAEELLEFNSLDFDNTGCPTDAGNGCYVEVDIAKAALEIQALDFEKKAIDAFDATMKHVNENFDPSFTEKELYEYFKQQLKSKL